MSTHVPQSRILIVRHGETNENVQGIIQGQLDTLLNDMGVQQARITGQALSKEPVMRIISSPLKRTMHTAEEIAAHHPSVQIEREPRLMERCFGVLQGQVYRGPAQKPEDTEGIEPSIAMVARLQSFWHDLMKDMKAQPSVVVLVSHGGAISTLVNQVVVPEGHAVHGPGITPSRFWNCSISDIHLYDHPSKPGTIVRWADVSHLHEATHKVVNVDEAAN